MASNILDAARSFISSDLISKAAGFLGESESSLSKALAGIIPASLIGITRKAESGGAETILDYARQELNSGILSNPASVFMRGGGGIPTGVPAMLSNLFGDKVGGLANTISQFAGVKGATASTLLGTVVPMIMALIGKQSADNGFSAASLTSWLSSQKTSFMEALPAGLSLSGLFGSPAGNAPQPAPPQQNPPRSGAWMTPLLIAVAAVALLLYIFKGCEPEEKAVPPVEQSSAPIAPPADTTSGARESLKVKLADGTEIDAYRGGIEDRLVNCLNSSDCKAGKDQWFDFDNLNFETGSARLTAESMTQIRNIVALLKAYPAAKIKIGGYTDKVGDDASNKKLSQDRADAVLAAIKNEGANPDQLVGAEGYGEEMARVAESASDEERRVDRRISVQLREK